MRKQRIEEIVTYKNNPRHKMVGKNMFQELGDFNLFMLYSHMLDCILKKVFRFCSLTFLDGFPFDHFNNDIEIFIYVTSMRCGSKMKEAVDTISFSVAIEDRRNNIMGRLRKTKFVGNGTIINLM